MSAEGITSTLDGNILTVNGASRPFRTGDFVENQALIYSIFFKCAVSFESNAFIEFKELETLNFADFDVKIGSFAFSYCQKLHTVSFVRSPVLESGSFRCSFNLVNFNIQNPTTTFFRDDLVICNKHLIFATKKLIGPIELQNNDFDRIGISAFLACRQLTKLTITKPVLSIGDSCFPVSCTEIFCDNSSGVTNIDGRIIYVPYKNGLALQWISSLYEGPLVLPNNVLCLLWGSTTQASGITSISIPRKFQAFLSGISYCTNLESIRFATGADPTINNLVIGLPSLTVSVDEKSTKLIDFFKNYVGSTIHLKIRLTTSTFTLAPKKKNRIARVFSACLFRDI